MPEWGIVATSAKCVIYGHLVTTPEPLMEQVRRRLLRLNKTKRLHQGRLAERLGILPSAVSKNLTSEGRPLSIAFVEAAADLTGEPIAELMVPDGSVIKQLDADEAALLRHLRLWPKSVSRALVAFVAFFADEAPAAGQTRNLHELWRGLEAKDREWLYGVAVLLREGSLPPDLREGLVQRLRDEANTRRVLTTGRRREKP